MNAITGFITEVTAEKRGPNKHYRRFRITTPDNETLSGWVFSSITIEETTSGNILLEAEKNNSAVRLHGRISTEEGEMKTIKVSINSKNDKSINWVEEQIERPDFVLTTTLIRDALLSNTPNRLEAVVLDQSEEVHFNEIEKQSRYKIIIIGDSSGTVPLLVYNELIECVTNSENYAFTQIKCKKIRDKIILTTSATSTISIITKMIIPDLNDMQESMSFNQIDVEQINTCFEEITHSKKEPTCTSCKQTLTPIVDKSHLLKCQKCSKFSLAKPNDFQTSVVILIDNQKTSFFTTKDIFEKYFKEQNPNLTTTSENLSEFYLVNGPWLITLSHFRRQVLNINKN